MDKYYFPMIKKGQFPSVKAMCAAKGLNRALVQHAIDNATTHPGENVDGPKTVVCDEIGIGDPMLEISPVLQLEPDGSVTLWDGVFSKASKDEGEVEQFILSMLKAGPPDGGLQFAMHYFWADERPKH